MLLKRIFHELDLGPLEATIAPMRAAIAAAKDQFERMKHEMALKEELNRHRKLKHIEVKGTGVSREQEFSRRLVDTAVTEGWMTIKGDVLTLKAKPESLVYKILRTPGKYPRADGSIETVNAFECVLDEKQHAKFQSRTIGEMRRGGK